MARLLPIEGWCDSHSTGSSIHSRLRFLPRIQRVQSSWPRVWRRAFPQSSTKSGRPRDDRHLRVSKSPFRTHDNRDRCQCGPCRRSWKRQSMNANGAAPTSVVGVRSWTGPARRRQFSDQMTMSKETEFVGQRATGVLLVGPIAAGRFSKSGAIRQDNRTACRAPWTVARRNS